MFDSAIVALPNCAIIAIALSASCINEEYEVQNSMSILCFRKESVEYLLFYSDSLSNLNHTISNLPPVIMFVFIAIPRISSYNVFVSLFSNSSIQMYNVLLHSQMMKY